MATQMEEKWISIDGELPNGIIKTLHADGKKDVCKVVNGTIYSHDPVTESPITHYKFIQP